MEPASYGEGFITCARRGRLATCTRDDVDVAGFATPHPYCQENVLNRLRGGKKCR
ncbi:hypothetical protein HMPREF1861_02090 [Corynebacterium kroppenstedtii]|nr:hypothetical protein HMPREF1861_02090 [Corynebacterium kroppenstedtii]